MNATIHVMVKLDYIPFQVCSEGKSLSLQHLHVQLQDILKMHCHVCSFIQERHLAIPSPLFAVGLSHCTAS